MLTELKLKSFKPDVKAFKRADGEGLYIQVETTGSKLWRFAYRFGGKQKVLALGTYPSVGLAQARQARNAAKEQLAAGIDPAAAKKAAVQKVKGTPTFRDMADAWVKLKNWSPRYAEQMARRIDINLNAHMGELPIDQIPPKKVLDTIRVIEDRGALVMARELLAVVRNIFQYAMVEELLDRDPTIGMNKALRDPKPVKHHNSFRASDLPEFFRRLRAYDGDEITRLGLLFTLHTMVRTNELLDLEPHEVDGDMWRIPPEKMKMNREHWVPLTKSAQAIYAAARKINRTGRPFPLSSNTMLYALYRMGYHGKATVHGMRSTASTILNESGLFHEDWIEKQLAHDEEDDSRGAYNAAEYVQQRIKMMQWWSDYLDTQAKVVEPDEIADLLS